MFGDRLLILKLKRGDADALRQIYEKYKDNLFSTTTLLLNNTFEAEDILHDIFVSFAKGADQFQALGSLKSYFLTCVVNRVRDRFRKKMYKIVGLNSVGPISSTSNGPAESVTDGEQLQVLSEALGELVYQQREVIILYLHGGMKFGQIAIMQGISINTAQARYRYGLNKLRSLVYGELVQ